MNLYKARKLWVLAVGGLLGCGGGGHPGGTPNGDAGAGGSGADSGIIGSKPPAGGGGDASNVDWPTNPNDASGPTATNGASLTIASAVQEATFEGVAAPSGSGFLVVQVSLANTGTGAPLSASPLFFSMTTTQSLVISAYPVQGTSACIPSVSVATGGHLACSVVFPFTSGEIPARVVYNDLQGDVASAAVPATSNSITVCSSVTAWLGSAGTNPACQPCVFGAENTACETIATSYSQMCEGSAGTCASCNTAVDFCTCEPGCDSATCQSLFVAMNQCIYDQCSAQCQ